MVDIQLNSPQRVVIALCIPAIVTVVVLFLKLPHPRFPFDQFAPKFWIARESWWAWMLAIVAVTAFELFLWRKRCKPGAEGADEA